MEEKIEEFQDHIRDLEKQNVQLKEKVMSDYDEDNCTVKHRYDGHAYNEFSLIVK